MNERHVLRVALDWEVDGIDPPQSFGGWNTGRVVQQTHESLMEDDFDTAPTSPGQPTSIVPRLAQSCDVSDDARRFLFRLRPGIRFHDGAPLDAEAVVLNYARFSDPTSPMFSHQAAALNRAAGELIAKVRAIDSLTVEITLGEPTPEFLRYMTQEDAPGAQSLISPLALERFGPDGCIDRAPGTGAFRLDRRFDTPHGSAVELVRNDDYWGGQPRLSGIRFLPFPDLDDRLKALVEGRVDMAYSLEGSDLEELAAQGFEIPEYHPPYIWYLVFNLRDPQMADIRIRRAIAHAINREALSNKLFPGSAVPAFSMLPPGSPSYDPQAYDPYPHDPDRARALLAEAGAQDGLTLHALGARAGSAQLNPSAIYQQIEQDLAAIGVRLKITLRPDWVDYFDEWRQGAASGISFSEMSWAMSSDLWLRQILHTRNAPPVGFNVGYAADSRLDDLLDRASGTLADAERLLLYREADRRVMEELPVLPLLNTRRGMVALSPRVKGLVSINQCWHDLRGVHLD